MSNPTQHQRLLEYCQRVATKVIAGKDCRYYLSHSEIFPQEMDALVIHLHAIVLGEKCADPTVVKYPADWWEALKARWFPEWALKRWPARMARYTLEHKITYPNMPITEIKGPYVPFTIERFTEDP